MFCLAHLGPIGTGGVGRPARGGGYQLSFHRGKLPHQKVNRTGEMTTAGKHVAGGGDNVPGGGGSFEARVRRMLLATGNMNLKIIRRLGAGIDAGCQM